MPSPLEEEVAALTTRSARRIGDDISVLFYGSTTFACWADLERRFPGLNVVNHGISGATMADCIDHFDTLVTPLKPRALVLQAGDIDLDNGDPPDLVRERVEHIVLRKRAALGHIPLAYVSIGISPARFPVMHLIEYTNRIIERSLFPRADVHFVDITRRMVGRGLEGLGACYGDDLLHMNRYGYDLWTRALGEYLFVLDRLGTFSPQ